VQERIEKGDFKEQKEVNKNENSTNEFKKD
jgi:hypothetical protein